MTKFSSNYTLTNRVLNKNEVKCNINTLITSKPFSNTRYCQIDMLRFLIYSESIIILKKELEIDSKNLYVNFALNKKCELSLLFLDNLEYTEFLKILEFQINIFNKGIHIMTILHQSGTDKTIGSNK